MTLGDYLALITNYHATRPRFMNTVAVLVQPLVDAQAMLQKLTTDFDLDTAVGVQLDMVGQWIGRTRFIKQPITGVFFSFDMDGSRVGFDQGVWQGPYDPLYGARALDDDTYRSVLKLQAIANQWDGTLPSIMAQFDALFPGVVIDDRGDKTGELMTCHVLIPGPEISSLLLAVLEQDFPIKASGVRYSFIETTVSTVPLFGFDIDGPVIGGFDHAAWGKVILQT